MKLIELYLVLTYIDLSASSAGLDPKFDVYFLAIANASSLIGRSGGGFISDRFGKLLSSDLIVPGGDV
jgi:MFS transporter, MCT family, solute carrier family 16 (monocarboxylic acid transporters), member 10